MTAVLVITWMIIGFVLAVVIGTELGPLFGFRNMEGASAIFGMFFGPFGAIAGAIFGFRISRKFADRPVIRRRILGGTWLLIALLVAGGFLFEWIRTYDRLSSSGNSWSLLYEVRLPVTARAPEKMSEVSMELRSDKETRQSVMNNGMWLKRQGDRVVLQAYVDLYRATPSRTIAVRIGDGPTYLFKARIAARPQSATMSEWFPVDEVDDNVPGQKPRLARPDEMSEISYAAR